jgi:flagellar biosynthetic protein FliR
MMGKLVGYSFLVALQISVPFVMLGVLMQLSFGLINRLVPSLQVFFLATPAVVASGFALLAIALPGMSAWFLRSYDNSFSFILVR